MSVVRQRIEAPELSSTLSNSSSSSSSKCLPQPRQHFRRYLRSLDGLSSEDAVKMSLSEMRMEFLCRTDKLEDMTGPDLEKLGRGFFGHVYKLPLENKKAQSDLAETLKKVPKGRVESAKANLRVAREEIWMKVEENHEQWVNNLKEEEIVTVGKSGEHQFNGWVAKKDRDKQCRVM